MPDFDLSRVSDLLARLDQEAAAPLYSHDDLVELHECCAESATAIRALMAEARASGVRLADLSKSEIEIAVAAEREACAKVCDDRGLSWVAATIRARGAA